MGMRMEVKVVSCLGIRRGWVYVGLKDFGKFGGDKPAQWEKETWVGVCILLDRNNRFWIDFNCKLRRILRCFVCSNGCAGCETNEGG